MLSINPSKAFRHALIEYLRQADYYSEGMKVEGRALGRLCEKVGLCEGMVVSDEAFARLASNHHALTGDQLTPRMAADRRAGYDATFNAPKSVSIQAFIGDDKRLIVAHQIAVREAFRELENFASYQDGRGINKRHVRSDGGLVAVEYLHGESRALDPHLHSHAYTFNVVEGKKGLLALESSPIFEHARYLTEVYRNALAREVQKLGYQIERQENGFELAGVPRELIQRFSKRAQERDALIAAKEAELGREITRNEIAILVRENRAKKQYELTPEEVRRGQLSQVTEGELKQLQALRIGRTPASSSPPSLAKAVLSAKAHVFERRTVVSTYEFMGEVMRQAYGRFTPQEIEQEVTKSPGELLIARGYVTTQAALDRENALVTQINAGIGACPRNLGRISRSSTLSPEQKTVVETILGSRDRVVVLRGKAGTGKTHTLATIIEGLRPSSVACFAPTTKAVEILQQDGASQREAGATVAARVLGSAETIQRLSIDFKRQATLGNGVIIVDEYGLLSVRQLTAVLNIADRQKARVILVGDSAQHKSVEAGDAARIVETETRVKIAELREVRRQAANPAYRAAAEALAEGNIALGLQKLDAMNAIVEVENPTDRRVQMVEEWFAATQETKSVRTRRGAQTRAKTALMVAPTWAEIDQLNTHARTQLRSNGRLGVEDWAFVSLRPKNWSDAQQKDVRNYAPGHILVAHRNTKLFRKHDELRVIRRENERLVVVRGTEEFSVSPRQSGLSWAVCEERPISVSAGEQLRLRAVAQAYMGKGPPRRLANGTTVTVQGIDAAGRIVLAGGAVLLNRQVILGYAMTSHAAQGLTVDKVFLAGAASEEGLYVSATRGRESVRIFVSDRQTFLDAAGLRSEARISALEFVRETAAQRARAWHYLRQVIAYSRNEIGPAEVPAEVPALNFQEKPLAAKPAATAPKATAGYQRPTVAVKPNPIQRMRL